MEQELQTSQPASEAITTRITGGEFLVVRQFFEINHAVL
jgi:hypothetical protein